MPIEIDPPARVASLAEHRSQRDWQQGWRAACESLAGELEAAYERGLRARPCTPRFNLDPLALAFAFILGMVIASAILQAHTW